MLEMNLTMHCFSNEADTTAQFMFETIGAAEVFLEEVYADALERHADGTYTAKYLLFGHRYTDTATLA